MTNNRKRKRKGEDLNPENWEVETTVDDWIADDPELVMDIVEQLRRQHKTRLVSLRVQMNMVASVGGTEDNRQLDNLRNEAVETFKNYQWLVDYDEKLSAMLNGRGDETLTVLLDDPGA